METITALIPSTTVLVSVSTATSVTSPVVSSTAVLSTKTIFSTTSTETITIIGSTETEVSILGTSYNTVIVQTNDVTDILATDTVFSTSTILTTVVSNNVISLPTGTETCFTAVATATSTNVATFTAPAIAARAVATLKSLGSSLVSTYGVTRVSSACSCILTSAASVQTILVTVSAPSYTLTQTAYTTATITDYFEATVTLPTTLETIVSATTTTTPVAVPTGFALRISSPGHIYDGTYVSVTFNGVAIYMGSTPTLSTASTFILSTPQNYNYQITYTGVPKYINSSSLWNNWIMGGANNQPQEIITLYQASFLGVGDTTATHNPLQCVFTGPWKYTGTLLCSVRALAAQYNTLFSLYTMNPTGVLITRTINVGTQQAQLIGVPLF